MKCLRCGYCCQNCWIIIVDDPKKGIRDDNLKEISSERCQHLRGKIPGKFSCALHKQKWYKYTPCFAYGQVEKSKKDVCRVGAFLMKKIKMKKIT